MRYSIFNIQNSKFHPRGFTLVEMIVAISLFTVVLFIATSAFLSIVNADRKSRSVRIAIDNLNLALEDMTRKIKTGTTYNCADLDFGSTVNDCPAGGASLLFTNQDGTRARYYWYSANKAIMRTIGTVTQRVTSPEITITKLNFIVSGSAVGVSGGGTDTTQPMVVINIEGSVGTNLPIKLQATVTQRAYDI